MIRQSPVLAALVVIGACSRPKPPASPLPLPVTASQIPDRVFGIVLRQPLESGVLAGRLCFSGRQFALEDGFYHITSDDILIPAPEEHRDTAAVLAALDSFTVCKGRSRELDATAIVTLLDSVVGHAMFYWPDGRAPTYDAMLATLTRTNGEPYQNAWGVRYWSADSMNIYVNKRSIYGPGTSIGLGDARVCERYEREVHRNNNRDRRSYPCWKKPVRLDPGEIFTERPVSMADSDLNVLGIRYDVDSTEVRRTLGAPTSTDSISRTYPGLRVWFEAGRVRQVTLTTPQHATARGLRVGDRITRAKELYGTPCMREQWIYCRTVTSRSDNRGIALVVKDLVITEIRIGRVFTISNGP